MQAEIFALQEHGIGCVRLSAGGAEIAGAVMIMIRKDRLALEPQARAHAVGSGRRGLARGGEDGTGSRRMRSDQSFRTKSQAPNSATMAKLAISIACVALVMVMEVPRSTSQAAPTRPMAIKP